MTVNQAKYWPTSGDHRELPPLNLGTLARLAELQEACEGNHRVRWDLSGNGRVVDGVARHFVKDPTRAYFLTPDDDVRVAYIRFSGTFEMFMPVRQALELMEAGLLAVTP